MLTHSRALAAAVALALLLCADAGCPFKRGASADGLASTARRRLRSEPVSEVITQGGSWGVPDGGYAAVKVRACLRRRLCLRGRCC